jgi:hypothetical protein
LKGDIFQLLAKHSVRNPAMWKNKVLPYPQLLPPALAIAAVYLVGITPALTQGHDSIREFEACKAITADQARLDCLKKLLPKPSSTDAPPVEDGAAAWRLIKTSRPNGAADAIAILRTADTGQSDPDLAGLMIRCQEKPGLEVALALVRPFPPRSRRDVVINSGTTEAVLHAESSSVGTVLVLPIEATAFTTGPFRELKRLSVRINDPESDIRGVIPLDGISSAIAKLSTNCPPG